MKKYFSHLSLGMCGGMSSAVVFEAKSLEEAQRTAHEHALENAEAYGYFTDLDYFGDYDHVGLENEDYDAELEGSENEEEKYSQTGYLEYQAVPYVPEEHDGYF